MTSIVRSSAAVRGAGGTSPALVLAVALLAAAGIAHGEPKEARDAGKKKTAQTLKTPVAGAEEAPEMSAGRIEQTSPGEYVLAGEVDFRYGIAHLLADTLRYSESARTATAEGNVVLQFGASQVSGDRIQMNLDTGQAVVENARAYIDPDIILQAEKLERISEETYKITRGTITTCTQPIPYWSFYVGSAIVNVGRYAHMTNAAFRAGPVPVFWSPYLVWPIKEDRSPGLLLPHFGYTHNRGWFISDALYLPLGRSVDATLQFDFFNGAVSGLTEQLPQAGQGLEVRYVPGASASGLLTAYYIRERLRPEPGADVVSRNRYEVSLAHTQRFASGFRLLADLNMVSDLDYYQEFEREIRYSTNPTVFSQIDLSRQSGPWALNVRLNRQLQYVGTVEVDSATRLTEDTALWRLPEVKFQGRGLRIARSRFYLTFESSFDGLAQRTRTFDPDSLALLTDLTMYNRFDIYPTISGNFTPVPWLDISPLVSFRGTYYTETYDESGPPLTPGGDAIFRRQFRFGISAVGPRLFRLYGSDLPGWTHYKHTFEPRVSYDYVPETKGGERIIPFDEVDAAIPSSNLLSYSVTSRLFAKKPPRPAKGARDMGPVLSGSFASLVLGEEAPTRHEELVPAQAPAPPAAPALVTQPPEGQAGGGAPEGAAAAEGGASASTIPAPQPRGGETYVPPDVSTGTGVKTPFGPRGPASAGEEHQPGVGPVEIATFEIAQRYSLDNLRPLSVSSALDTTSSFSPVELTIRYNPTYSTSLDLRTNYDILFHDIRSVSVSGNLRAQDRGYVRLSWFYNRDLEGMPASYNPLCATDPTRVVARDGPDSGRCFNDASQIRLLGGVALLGRKITADVEGSYDIVNSFLQDQRYRVGYNTQCCGLLFEITKRSFVSSTLGQTTATEFRFVLNLRGVSTFLDLNGRSQ